MPRRLHGRRASARRGFATRPNGPHSAGFFCAVAILGLGAFAHQITPASAAQPHQATSSRAARDEAVRSIPVDKLDSADKDKISATLSSASLYRRLPVQVTDCDPDMYLFLVRHPEVVVNIWEIMKISNVAIKRTGDNTFRASDGAGTLCTVKFCYSDHETQVIYAEGSYNGPLFARPVQAKCVLILKSGYVQETNGHYYVTSRMDTFIQIEHVGLELLAKTLQPLVHSSADYNFVTTAAFLENVSRTAEANPGGMSRLSQRLTNLPPEVRQRFADLSLEVARKARQRDAIQTSSNAPIVQSAQRSAASER